MAIMSQKNIVKGTRIEIPGVIWCITDEHNETVEINYLSEYEIFRQRHDNDQQIMQNIGTLQSHETNQTRLTQNSLKKMFQVNGWRHRCGTVVSVVAGSFFNHSCDPDFAADVRLKADKMYVTALRDIAQGREVFVSYLGKEQLDARVDHREESLTSWGFFCECLKCKSDTSDLHTSAANGDVEAQNALVRLKYFRDHMSPIVIPDEGDPSMKYEAHDAQRPSFAVRQENAIIVIDDSSDEEQEGVEFQGAGAAHPTDSALPARLDSEIVAPLIPVPFRFLTVAVLEAEARARAQNVAAEPNAGTLDARVLAARLDSENVAPLIPVPFRFLTVAVLEAEARARAQNVAATLDARESLYERYERQQQQDSLLQALPENTAAFHDRDVVVKAETRAGVHTSLAANVESEHSRLGQEQCVCRSGKLFKDCHQLSLDRSYSNPTVASASLERQV